MSARQPICGCGAFTETGHSDYCTGGNVASICECGSGLLNGEHLRADLPPCRELLAALAEVRQERDEAEAAKERWAKLAYKGRDDLLAALAHLDTVAEDLREASDSYEAALDEKDARLDAMTEALREGAAALWALNDWLAEQPAELPAGLREQAGSATVKLQRLATSPEQEPKP
ncbi:MAG TPA: hypothetical protein VNI55_14585 [Gaiellaceae bacterium]|nr:hypothetical protein [Gaiellaceae bacterium]